jgi:predicted  nucleic acid-binding Zn-ribbon protein
VTERLTLAGYVALQRLLTQRLALQKELETPPPELAELRSRNAERDAVLAEDQRRREQLLSEQAALEHEVNDLYAEREHVRKQKSQVTNMKQLTAVVSALDHVQVQVEEKEAKLKTVWEELAAIDARAASLNAESPEERRQREEAERAWEERRAAGEVELLEVKRQIRDVQRDLDDDAVKRFRKLWTSRKPLAVVPVDGDACSACHAVLRPALLQRVRAGTSLDFCESCRRLLYDPDQFAA